MAIRLPSRRAAARAALLSLACIAGAAHAGPRHTTRFDTGADGWSLGIGAIDAGAGNPAPALRERLETWGVTFSNASNPAFVGDYTRAAQVRLAIDVETDHIVYEGSEVPRHLIVELRDHANPEGGYPYTSVWYDLGVISKAQAGFRHHAVAFDPNATALPAGWGGYGAEDAQGNPKLPDDRTFASVMAHVDEVVFTTMEPGYFYGFAVFDVVADNMTIAAQCKQAADAAPQALGLARCR
jgi:hypothetical protein